MMKTKYATIIEHVTNYNEDGTRYITDEAILMIKDNNELYLKKVIAEAVERTTEYKNNKNTEIIINGNSETGYTINIINYQIMTNIENILDFLN